MSLGPTRSGQWFSRFGLRHTRVGKFNRAYVGLGFERKCSEGSNDFRSARGMCCKTIFTIRTSNIDSRTRTSAQRRFKNAVQLDSIIARSQHRNEFCNTIPPKPGHRADIGGRLKSAISGLKEVGANAGLSPVRKRFHQFSNGLNERLRGRTERPVLQGGDADRLSNVGQFHGECF